MSWTLSPRKHQVFERNPLVAVVVELRFHTILKVPDRIADFQESVRASFPAFQEVSRQLVTMGPVAPVELRTEKLFNFHKQDESATITLSTSSLVLESRRHENRDRFISEAEIGIDALKKVYGPVVPTRLGLRYVDVIDKEKIEADLARPTSWSALISEPFLRVPTGMVDLNETAFACEVASPVAPVGGMTVRYGLMKDLDARLKYRLDVDRYVEVGLESSAIVPLLHSFADDIFSVFYDCKGPDLEVWMRGRQS